MSERRYNDEEAAAIFERAAEDQLRSRTPAVQQERGPAPLTSGEGMTLQDLQEIGREVGIPPALIERAAVSVSRIGDTTERRYFGLPLGVGRTVRLGRQLSDAEWERLVVELRETFDARGRVREDGAFRQWTNGNLQALVEPTADGHQLRMKTMNGGAFAYMNTGLATIGVSALMGFLGLFGGASGNAMFMVAGIGVALFAFGALRLPSWARTRRDQMKKIAERITESP